MSGKVDGRGKPVEAAGSSAVGSEMPPGGTPPVDAEAAPAREATRTARPKSVDMAGLSLASELQARLDARAPAAPAAPTRESWIGTSAKLDDTAIQAKNDKQYSGGRLGNKTDLQITRIVPANEAEAQAIKDQFAKGGRDGSDSLLLREPATGAFFVVAADEIKNLKSFEVGQRRLLSFTAPDGQVREASVVVEARDDDRDGFLNNVRKALGKNERPDEQVYKVLGQHEFDAATSFTPSVGAELDKSKFKKHEKTYDLPFDFETAWSTYTGAPPDQAWPGGSSTFNRSYSRADNKWTEKGDPGQKPIQPGSIYFIDLEIAKGLPNIPAGFEITRISKEDKTIEFTYLEQNVSHGRQTMKFVETPDGKTQIVHTSYFTSGKEWRDKLYPPVHEKLVDGFHANMQRLMAAKTP